MPLSRYQIRTEYSLADPELYKAADKDDPEALLEGVAMAGLVGILRQLGDLAEFAAEIFHDLHEEVMVTAARGHSLTSRVQQLEAEFPAIEKAFLSQTNHSSFFYNPGSDWHPNIRVDQSLIARGDLPRFVMDSYEECRGPPRLFLLDKFDVAGAGACLKRYSDPSFFKSEPLSFGITGTDVQREKKVRKAKKKGSRWRNGETPDALPTSNAKLHQLFLEERITNGFSDPARRVKLKRRLNGFPFSSKSGESYMEKFLKSPSPDNKEVHEIPVDSTTYESSFEIATISAVSPEKELDPRSINLSSSPPKEEIIQELFVDKLNEVPSGTGDSVMLQPDSVYVPDIGVESYNIPSTLEMEDSEKEIAVDCGSKTDESINDYQSDDIASEIDNYMDALTTMESEMDTDPDIKIKREARDSYANGVQLQAHSSESQSMENSALSDAGNSSSKKEISSFSNSDTHSSAAENTHSGGEVSSDVFPSTEIRETKIVDSSLDPLPISREIPWSNPRGSFVTDGLFTEAAKIPSQISEHSDQTASLSASDSDPSFTKEGALMVTEADEIVANSSLNITHIPSISEATEEKDYDSPLRLSDENQLMDESEGGDKNPSLDVPHIPSISEATEEKDFDFPKRLSGENQLVDETEGGDKDPSLDIPHIPSISEATEEKDYDSPRRLSGENQFVIESGGGDKDKSEIVPDASYLSISSHSQDDFLLHALTEDHLISELNDEDANPDENVVSLTYQDLNDDSGPPLINHENSSLLFTSDQPLDELHPEDQDLGVNAPLVPNLSDSPSQLRDGFPVAVSADGYQTSTADGLSNKAAEEKGGQSTVDSLPKSGTNEDLHIPNSDVNQTGEQNSVMPLNDGQPVGQTLYLDADAGDTVSEVDGIGRSAGEISDNVTPKEDTSSELVEYLVPETNAEVPPIRSSEEQTSFGREVEPLDRGEGVELGEAACDSNVSERDATGEPLLLAGSHIVLDKIDTDSVNAPAGNNAVDDDYGPSGDLRTSTEVCFPGSEGDVKGLATEESGLSEIPEDLCTTDGLHQQIFSLQNSDSCQVVDNDQSESESQVVNDVSAPYLLLATKDNSDATTATEVQLPSEENKLESSHTEENVELLTNKLDLPCVLEANSEVVSNLDQTCHEKLIDHVGPSSSNSLPGYLPNDSSETDFSSQGSNDINASGHPVYPSTSILSSFPLIPNASEIHVDEMPPMPPLPPVQWRMTKFQHALPGQERLFVQNNASAFPPMFPSKADRDTQPVNQLLPESALGYGNSHPDSEQPIGFAVHLNPFISQGPSVVHHGNLKDNILPQEGIQQTGISQLAGSDSEVLQNSLQGEDGENEKPGLISSSNLFPADTAPTYALGLSRENDTESLNQGPPETSLNEKELVQSPTITGENVVTSDTRTLPSKTEYEQPEQTMPAIAHAFGLSNEKLIRPLNQVALETSIKDQELGNRSGHSGENLGSYDNNPVSAKAQDEEPQHALSTSEATLAWSVGEESKGNGLRPMKLPRPRNPLIDAVAALDKSKLRKVTERIRPQMQEEDERDSILEQIRTKSFNLKPAVVTRPSIPGPTTNLKVAAILEKAKTIRQAFAGSDDDDDDDDSWSE